MNELNVWNAKEFAKRPPGQKVEQTLEAMRASRDALRQAVGSFTDADLGRQVWMPILAGWVTARDILVGCVTHSWGEFIELSIRSRVKSTQPGTSALHTMLNFYMNFLPMALNREMAQKTRFTMVMEFPGPGGGAWSFRVADGVCKVTEEHASKPDLLIKQGSETFIKLFRGMQNPVLLLLTRQMKVKGLRKMGTFAKLFPKPKPDQVLALGPEVAGGIG